MLKEEIILTVWQLILAIIILIPIAIFGTYIGLRLLGWTSPTSSIEVDEEGHSTIIDYRTDVINDIIKHISFWLDIDDETKIKSEYNLTPNSNTSARLYMDFYEFVMYFDWTRRAVKIDCNYYITSESRYVKKSKWFKFKDNFVNHDAMCNFINTFVNETILASEMDSKELLTEILKESNALQGTMQDEQLRDLLFDAVGEFNKRLNPQMIRGDKDYLSAISKLNAYVLKHYKKELIDYVKQQTEENN